MTTVIDAVQDFFSTKVAVKLNTTGAGNFYITTLPTPTNGYLVINRISSSKREIIRYTGKGTDGTGNYVTIAASGDRGLGGTTAQTHEIDEPVEMNFTAEHWADLDAAIASIIAAGAPNASTSVRGISQMAVKSQIDSRAETGSTGAKLFVNPKDLPAVLYHDYAADAGANDDYVISVTPVPTAYVAGDVYTFKANTANTGAATLNVNSLGAKTIKKDGSADLGTNDIVAGQIIVVVYDGTNFQLIGAKQTAYTPSISTGIATKNLADASTTQVIPHGLGKVPNVVTFHCTAVAVGELGIFDGVYTAGGQVSSRAVYNDGGTEFAGTSTTKGIILYATNNSANFQEGTVTVDDTNINIAWVKNGSPAVTYSFIWKAEA